MKRKNKQTKKNLCAETNQQPENQQKSLSESSAETEEDRLERTVGVLQAEQSAVVTFLHTDDGQNGSPLCRRLLSLESKPCSLERFAYVNINKHGKRPDWGHLPGSADTGLINVVMRKEGLWGAVACTGLICEKLTA